MAENENSLGLLQKEWIGLQKILRKKYPWLGEIDDIPPEEYLESLKACVANPHNTTCFTEGICMNPNDPRCSRRKRI